MNIEKYICVVIVAYFKFHVYLRVFIFNVIHVLYKKKIELNKSRRCQYTDGDTEDLSIKDLCALKNAESKRHAERKKYNEKEKHYIKNKRKEKKSCRKERQQVSSSSGESSLDHLLLTTTSAAAAAAATAAPWKVTNNKTKAMNQKRGEISVIIRVDKKILEVDAIKDLHAFYTGTSSRSRASHAEDRHVESREKKDSYDEEHEKEYHEETKTTIRNVKEALSYLEKQEQKMEYQKGVQAVMVDDKPLITDFIYHIMKQLHFCQSSEHDTLIRIRNANDIQIGYGGLICVHCSESNNPKKFFMKNVHTFANNFTCISTHLIFNCNSCPTGIKDALLKLKEVHSEQMEHLKLGSQKKYFRRMWRRLHNLSGGVAANESKSSSGIRIIRQEEKGDMEKALNYLEKKEKEMEKRNEIQEIQAVTVDDKHLITDFIYHIMKQIRFCRYDESEGNIGARVLKSTKIGYGGLMCVHCANSDNPRKFFLTKIDTLEKNFRWIPSHVLNCDSCPAGIKDALLILKENHSQQKEKLKLGSQKKYFCGMWDKLRNTDDRDDSSPESKASINMNIKTKPAYFDAEVSLAPETKPTSVVKQITGAAIEKNKVLIGTGYDSTDEINPTKKDNKKTEICPRTKTNTLLNKNKQPYAYLLRAGQQDAAFKDALNYLDKEAINMKSRLNKSEKQVVASVDKGLITDFSFHVLSQVRFCQFDSQDTLKNRTALALGFGGLACAHCSGKQSPRKFFWSCARAMEKHFNNISAHLRNCKWCPAETKKALDLLRKRHLSQLNKMQRGSQKKFLHELWNQFSVIEANISNAIDTELNQTTQNEGNSIEQSHVQKYHDGYHSKEKKDLPSIIIKESKTERTVIDDLKASTDEGFQRNIVISIDINHATSQTKIDVSGGCSASNNQVQTARIINISDMQNMNKKSENKQYFRNLDNTESIHEECTEASKKMWTRGDTNKMTGVQREHNINSLDFNNKQRIEIIGQCGSFTEPFSCGDQDSKLQGNMIHRPEKIDSLSDDTEADQHVEVPRCKEKSMSSMDFNPTQSFDKLLNKSECQTSNKVESQHAPSLRKSHRQQIIQMAEGIGEVGYCFTKFVPRRGLRTGMVVEILGKFGELIYKICA